MSGVLLAQHCARELPATLVLRAVLQSYPRLLPGAPRAKPEYIWRRIILTRLCRMRRYGTLNLSQISLYKSNAKLAEPRVSGTRSNTTGATGFVTSSHYYAMVTSLEGYQIRISGHTDCVVLQATDWS